MILCQVIRACARARVRAREGQRAGHTGPARTGLKAPPQSGGSGCPRPAQKCRGFRPRTPDRRGAGLRPPAALRPPAGPLPPCRSPLGSLPPSPAPPQRLALGRCGPAVAIPPRGAGGLNGGAPGGPACGRPRGVPRRGAPPSPRRLCSVSGSPVRPSSAQGAPCAGPPPSGAAGPRLPRCGPSPPRAARPCPALRSSGAPCQLLALRERAARRAPPSARQCWRLCVPGGLRRPPHSVGPCGALTHRTPYRLPQGRLAASA